MGKKLVRIRRQHNFVWGLWVGDAAHVLVQQASTLAEMLALDDWKTSGKIIEDIQSSEWTSPVTVPCQIICQGKNYLDHLLETGVKPKNKDFNLLFTKADSSLTGARSLLKRPEGVRLLDYELELGLVIGRAIDENTVITNDNWLEYICGFVMANDISARDIQIPQRQWFKGKSFRGFCPVGPWIYLLDGHEKQKWRDLRLELKVNGHVKQKASTSQLMHEPYATLKEISGIFDLRVGDLLLTGTPGGVAMKVPQKSLLAELKDVFLSDKEKFARFIDQQAASGRFLKNGDSIECTITSSDQSIDLGTQQIGISG